MTISRSGAIDLFHLLTETARDWMDCHGSEDRQTLGVALAVEHRYVADFGAGHAGRWAQHYWGGF
ncbi:MAG: hypothetical protein M3P18_23105 [Actinomycetota bacterium]|nr:hypothetical protein [Actinomycetota bacterium]